MPMRCQETHKDRDGIAEGESQVAVIDEDGIAERDSLVSKQLIELLQLTPTPTPLQVDDMLLSKNEIL